jgi:ABC-2 type transport system permease protein
VTTVEEAAERRPVAPAPRGALAQSVTDSLVVAKRNLIRMTRIPEMIIFGMIQPIMFVVLFTYVFGGSIQVGGSTSAQAYREFLMAGIFAQTVTFATAGAGAGIAEDMHKGLIDRFRSLPMARSAVLVGRTGSDLIKNFLLLVIVIGIGYLVGFKFENGLFNALGVVLLVIAVGFAFSWISACIGLALKQVEAVQAASFTWIFPVVFVSSAFVPVAGMSGFLQVVARNNPVTIWCNLARYLSSGSVAIVDFQSKLPVDTFEGLVFKSAAWIIGLLVVFVPLAIHLYRKLD